MKNSQTLFKEWQKEYKIDYAYFLRIVSLMTQFLDKKQLKEDLDKRSKKILSEVYEKKEIPAKLKEDYEYEEDLWISCSKILFDSFSNLANLTPPEIRKVAMDRKIDPDLMYFVLVLKREQSVLF